jgi:hypothetical protein
VTQFNTGNDFSDAAADEAEAPKVAIDAAYQRMRNVLVSDRLRGTE